MSFANKGFWQDRVHDGAVFRKYFIVRQSDDFPSDRACRHKVIPEIEYPAVPHSPQDAWIRIFDRECVSDARGAPVQVCRQVFGLLGDGRSLLCGRAVGVRGGS